MAPSAGGDLFDKQGRQIGTHFSGPTCKLDDGSAVVGDIMAKVDAPKPDAIQWLLLRAKSREGAGTLSATAYIRRTVTRAGVAPRTGCDANHLSEQARVCYSASYQWAEHVSVPIADPGLFWNLVLSTGGRFFDDGRTLG